MEKYKYKLIAAPDNQTFRYQISKGSSKLTLTTEPEHVVRRMVDFLNDNFVLKLNGRTRWIVNNNFCTGTCLLVYEGSVFLDCSAVENGDFFLHIDADIEGDNVPEIIPEEGIILPAGFYKKLILSNGICYDFAEECGSTLYDRGVNGYHAEIKEEID